MAAPSLDERELLHEFRGRLKELDLNDFQKSDMELLRWIRARDHNLIKAELMLKKHLQWRKEICFDQITSWQPPEHCQGLLPRAFLGFDNENSPLLVEFCGKWDLKKYIQEAGAESAMRIKWKMIAICWEAMRGKMTPEGVPVTQISAIVDLEGLSMDQATIQVFRQLGDDAMNFEANFPETLKKTVVINAPWYFTLFYKCVKPFLSEKTMDKIHIYGKNREEWMNVLKDLFPDSILPTMYGGSNDAFIIE